MAESLLLPLISRLEAIDGEISGRKLGLSLDLKEVGKTFEVILRKLRGLLADADRKQAKSRAVEDWLRALKEILYDAEDVLDDWYTRVSILQADDSGVTTEVSSYSAQFSCFQLLLSCLFCGRFPQPASVAHGNDDNIVHALKNIVDRLDPLIHDKDLLNLVAYQKQEHNLPRQLTSSLVDMSGIYGRNSDKETILSMLLGETSQQENQVHVPLISIAGMGGLGKTTLAQYIYNENRVKHFFDLRTWVCVSEPFDLQRVAIDIIEQAAGNAHQNFVSQETLLQRLCRSVQGKRFLLVLDDVWSEDPYVWTSLKLSLAAGARGSRIVVTTRNVRVAVMMGSIYTHMLGQLSDDDCWALFRKMAFSGRSIENSEKLADIGRDIAKKCKGVPLAVKCMASSMRFLSTVQEWRSVVSGVWDPHMIGKSLLPALLLSYHGLSPYLKACFMYCTIFPGDVVIKKEDLVKLWMAQGLLGLDEEKDLEMTGEKYFDELAMHSFFHDFQVNRDGKILTCRMHDLVHDFALFLTKSECSILKENETESRVTYFRHMNACNIESSSISKLKNLRSLTFGVSEPSVPRLLEVCCHLRVLRVLDLSYSDFKEMPSEIEWLPLLRYLDLSWNSSLTGLPETMCTLYNLQTLKLIGCKSLCKLPKGVGKLSKLRHLEIQGTEEMNHFPQSIGKLRHLRTLCKFIVSDGPEGCRIGELGCLNDLRGTLKITRLSQVKNTNEARHAELLQKKHLSLLELDFGFSWDVSEDVTEEDMKRMEGVLGGLQPDVNLEELVINDYPGSKFSFWMAKESLLPNLVTLELKECKNCILLPALGRLKSLEILVIEGLESVKHIGVEFYGADFYGVAFPKLKHLELCGMKELEYWEMPFIHFSKVMPRLCEIELDECPKLMGLPALGGLESLERLETSGLDSIEHIGPEFYGVDVGTSFPQLKTFKIYEMEEWKHWEIPFSNFEKVMPCLFDLQISNCPNLMGLPDLGRLESLERMELGKLSSLTQVGAEFLRISSDCDRRSFSSPGGSLIEVAAASARPNGELTNFASSSPNVVLFPKLRYFGLWDLSEWDEKLEETTGDTATSNMSVMLGLKELLIRSCHKLKVVPDYFFSLSLRKLVLLDCPQLMGTQPCLPPHLEELNLYGDVGVLSESLLPIITPVDNSSSRYPYLKVVKIFGSLLSSLPQGLSRFTSLQQLQFCQCKLLDLKLKDEWRHFSMLQLLDIMACPIIKERCSREEWGKNLGHQIPFQIIIDHVKI